MIVLVPKREPKEAAIELAGIIDSYLRQGKRVAWFISGGSSIPIAIKVASLLEETSNLKTSLVDEKFSNPAQSYTNWSELAVDPVLAKLTPCVLIDKNIHESELAFKLLVGNLMEWCDVSIGQFGIGEGYHTGGILASSPAVTDDTYTSTYKHDNDYHITVTTKLVGELDVAFINSFGDSKRVLVEHFIGSTSSIGDEPTQALKISHQTILVSDVIPDKTI
jgi:hypothetical protein